MSTSGARAPELDEEQREGVEPALPLLAERRRAHRGIQRAVGPPLEIGRQIADQAVEGHPGRIQAEQHRLAHTAADREDVLALAERNRRQRHQGRHVGQARPPLATVPAHVRFQGIEPAVQDREQGVRARQQIRDRPVAHVGVRIAHLAQVLPDLGRLALQQPHHHDAEDALALEDVGERRPREWSERPLDPRHHAPQQPAMAAEAEAHIALPDLGPHAQRLGRLVEVRVGDMIPDPLRRHLRLLEGRGRQRWQRSRVGRRLAARGRSSRLLPSRLDGGFEPPHRALPCWRPEPESSAFLDDQHLDLRLHVTVELDGNAEAAERPDGLR